MTAGTPDRDRNDTVPRGGTVRLTIGAAVAFAVGSLVIPSLSGRGTEPAARATAHPAAGVTYRTKRVATIPGAVRVVERSSLDPFVYVVSRNGTVTRMKRDGTGQRTVLNVSALTTTDSERGLLGLAFRRVGTGWEAFTNHTDKQGDTVIARWAVRSDGTFVRQPGGIPSVVITVDQPYANHNGGDVRTGPDGMIYVGMGDGGSGGDPERRAMDLGSLLGKILRIDPTHVTNGRGHAYRIPRGNPYVGKGRPEIWSIGLRNPWRFTFDSAGTLWVADVGQSTYEEVSRVASRGGYPGGRAVNFGWSAYEGATRYNDDVPVGGVTMPVHVYDHGSSRCSISGAAVATSRTLPGRAGWFLYGDYCSGMIVAFATDGVSTTRHETVAKDLGNITSVSSTSRTIYYTTLDGTVGTVSS